MNFRVLQKSILKLSVITLLAIISGCDRSVPYYEPPADLAEANERMARGLADQHGVNVIVRAAPDTVYVYAALEGSLIELKADNKGPVKKPEATKGFKINYLDALQDRKVIRVQHDIDEGRKYVNTPGYENKYTEQLAEIQRAVFALLPITYFDLDEVKGMREYSDARKQITHERVVRPESLRGQLPDFFTLVLTDPEAGMMYQITYHFQDLKQAFSNPPLLNQDELTKRTVSKLEGHAYLLGDTTGENFPFREITWPEFLTDQIENRITFQFTQSDFPPTGSVEDAVLEAVRSTVDVYEYEDFESVILDDLATGESRTISKGEF